MTARNIDPRFGSLVEFPVPARKFNLQRFAAEDEGRTEEPTERKKREAREEGRVAKSNELPQALVLLGTVITLYFVSGYMGLEFQNFLYQFWFRPEGVFATLDVTGTFELIWSITGIFLKCTVPLFVAALIFAVAGNVGQTGFLFTTKTLLPKASKISFTFDKIRKKILFSEEVFFNFIKSMAKFLIIAVVGFFIIQAAFDDLLGLGNRNTHSALVFLWESSFKMILAVAFLFIAFSIPDFMVERRRYIEGLKMTRQELQQEIKEDFGDPLIRSRMRQRQMVLLRSRMMSEVPKADVVITNPLRLAVALGYKRGVDPSPKILAKGQGEIAERIREIAKERGIPIMENKPLARALYRSVEIGEEIPESLFRAVAEILALVYKKKNEVHA